MEALLSLRSGGSRSVAAAEEVDVGVEVGVDVGAPPEVVAGEAAEGA